MGESKKSKRSLVPEEKQPGGETRLAMIHIKVAGSGETHQVKPTDPASTVEAVLGALKLSGRLQRANGAILLKSAKLEAGEYVLTLSHPTGAAGRRTLGWNANLTAFWLALATAREVDYSGASFLELEGGRFPFEGNEVATRLLIRESYRWLRKHALDYLSQKDEHGKQIEALIYILRGNAGIGKSLFLYYVMQSLAATRQTVVFQRRSRQTVVFTREGAFQGSQDGSTNGFEEYLEDPECWFLVDAVSPVTVHAKALFVTSPDYAVTKEALKRPGMTQKWMNVWSVSKELVPAGKQIFRISEADVRKRARELGLIPRYVLQQDQAINNKELERAINGCRFQDLGSCLLDTASRFHRMVVIEIKKGYSEGGVRIASAQIEAELAAKLERQDDDNAKFFLRSSGGTPAIQSLRASILARTQAHKALQTGGRFWCRDLDTQAEFWKELPACANSEILQDHAAIASSRPELYEEGMYEYGLEGLDAVVEPGRLYQITISERQEIHMLAVANFAARVWGLDNLEWYWAVDQQTFTSDFRKQPYPKTKEVTEAVAREAKGIKQYLLRLPDDIRLIAAHQDSDTKVSNME